MAIARLLAASAASLLAISSAKAADTVVMVEPEPVDYVRACDVYGSGFFFIPGTETCLRVGGYVRFRALANDEQFNLDPDGIDDYTVSSRVRARLEFDAREDTDYGTLRGKVRIEAQNRGAVPVGTANDGLNIAEAYVQLGGLTIGLLDSLWTHNDAEIEDGLLMEESDFAAGDLTTNRISYAVQLGDFTAIAGLEDDGDGDVVPDVLGKLVYKGDFGGVYLLGVYDEDSTNSPLQRRFGVGPDGTVGVYDFFSENPNPDGDGAFAVKGGVLLEDLVTENSIIKVEGHYAFDRTIYATVGDIGTYDQGGSGDNNFNNGPGIDPGGAILASKFQIGAAYRQEFGKFFAAGAAVYGETFDQEGFFTDLGTIGASDVAYSDFGSASYYGLATNIGYDVTENFAVLAELSYIDIDLPAGIDDFDQTRGFLQFRRDF